MKRKSLISLALMILAAVVLAVSCELVLDHFVYQQEKEVVEESAVYQLFPGGEPSYTDCYYKDGVLVSFGIDPQMTWSVSPEVPLADIIIRFSEPLTENCEIQVYYDDTGVGFTAEKALGLYAAAGTTEKVINLERGSYYSLRIDINGTVPLSEIDCDASVVVQKIVPGEFRVKRCIVFFTVLAVMMLLVWLYRKNEKWRDAIRTGKELLISDVVWAVLVSVAFSAYFSMYYHLKDVSSMEEVISCLLHPAWPVLIISFLILYGSLYITKALDIPLGDWLYKKRWYLGGCLLAICVFFNLNISSLHQWAPYLGNTTTNGVLLGESRAIRSDEWVKAIAVVKALSFENYPAFSTLIRATSTENVLIAGHIAWDISAIFRPFTWGFLLLGSASYGLSFNQFGMIIALFLLSFDFFMLVSKNRKLSFAFACVLLFSPFVQWWTSFDLFISSFALLLAGHKYLTTQSVRTKLICAVVVAVFAGNFTLLMYPAWQIPAAYILLAGLIWIIVSNRKIIKLRLRTDLPIIGGTILFLIVCGIIIYTRSSSAIYEMLNTVYPGTVRSNSPMSISKLAVNYLNMFSQYTAQYVPGPNLSEAADFITFFPIGILLCVYGMIRNRKADVFSIAMISVSAFLAVFAFTDVPEIIRKLTLMSFSMSQRILPWFGFVQIILLFRGVSLLNKGVKWYISIPVSVLFAGAIVYWINASNILAGETLILTGIGVLLFIIVWSALRAGKDERALRTFSTIMVVFSLFTAGMVHPVQIGMAEIEDSEIVKQIQDVTEEDSSGKWLVEGLSFPYGMVPLMGGAPTINCVNNYPNLELWYKLDPERDDEYSYNRYVSQIVTDLITDEETSFSVGWVDDIMMLHLNVNDLKTMEVSYILTNRLLEGFSNESVTFTRVSSASFFIIYRVEYSDVAN